MYQVSEAFRQAMAEHKPQRILLEFRDRSFSNEHISIDDGVSYSSVYNASHDMTIGECNSALISFDLFNEDHELDTFAFGRFSAWIGVETEPPEVSTESNSLVRNADSLVCVTDGVAHRYELIPLGVFIAPKPSQVAKQTIHIEAYDQMTLFDRDMPDAAALGITYPITAAGMLHAICDYVGVVAASYDFLNAWIQLESEPDSFSGVTMRDVIGQIAEAAGSNARMNRDGQLELVWFNQTNVRFDEHDYTEFTPTVYEVTPINKLTIRNADSTKEAVVGAGDNSYLVQDNAFLRQDDSTKPVDGSPKARMLKEAESPADLVYNRLTSAPVFHPADVELFTDPTLDAGDVVTISSDGKQYAVPVYSLDLKWNGDTIATVQATGEEKRQPLPALQRKIYRSVSGGYRRAKKQIDDNGEFAKIIASAIVGEGDDLVSALIGITKDGNIVHRVSDAEANITNVEQGVDHILQQVITNNEVMTQINQTVAGIEMWNKDTEGNLGELLVTAKQISGKVSDAEGNIGQLVLRSNEFSTTLTQHGEIMSQIQQLQDQINLTVRESDENIGKLSVTANAITQTIKSTGEMVSELKTTANGLYYTLTQHGEQLADFEVNQEHIALGIGNANTGISGLHVTATSIERITKAVQAKTETITVDLKAVKDNIETIDGRVATAEAGLTSTVKVETLKTEMGKHINVKAVNDLVARVDNTAAGVKNLVDIEYVQGQLENYITKKSGSELFVDADELDDKVDARMGVYLVDDGKGNKKTLAQILAEEVEIDGIVKNLNAKALTVENIANIDLLGVKSIGADLVAADSWTTGDRSDGYYRVVPFALHKLTVDGTEVGKVMGTADVNFNIADTETYKNGVSASYNSGFVDGRIDGINGVEVTGGDSGMIYNPVNHKYSMGYGVYKDGEQVGETVVKFSGTEAYDAGVEAGKTESGTPTVTQSDIQLESFSWVDSTSSMDMSGYTTLSTMASLIKTHKNGKGYITFRANVLGTTKNYRVAIG